MVCESKLIPMNSTTISEMHLVAIIISFDSAPISLFILAKNGYMYDVL